MLVQVCFSNGLSSSDIKNVNREAQKHFHLTNIFSAAGFCSVCLIYIFNVLHGAAEVLDVYQVNLCFKTFCSTLRCVG